MAKDYYRFPSLERTRASGRAHQFIICQVQGGLSTITDVSEGDLAFCCDLQKLYVRKSSAWEEVSGGSGSPAWGAITGTLSSQTDLQTALNGKAASSHGHAISDVTGLQTALNAKVNSPITDGDIPAGIARDSEVTSAITTHEGAANPHSVYQLSSQKNAANGYAGLSAGSKLTGSQQTYGSAANTACEGNDARLSDARTPLTHDIISAHNGFPGGTSTFLRADGTFASPGGGAGADPPEGSYAPGSFTIATGKFRVMAGELQLTGSQELTVQGTGRLSVGN